MKKLFIYFLFGVLLFYCQIGVNSKDLVKIYNLSIKKSGCVNNEGRVIAFQIKLEGAGVCAISKIPEDWNYEVNCEAADAIIVKGGITHGSAALDCDYFKDFLTINSFYAVDNKALKISMKVWMVDKDEKETVKLLTRNDLMLQKVEKKPPN